MTLTSQLFFIFSHSLFNIPLNLSLIMAALLHLQNLMERVEIGIIFTCSIADIILNTEMHYGFFEQNESTSDKFK